MKRNHIVLLLLIALLCALPISKELFKVIKDFHGDVRVVRDKSNNSPHEELREYLAKDFTNRYIKIQPIVKYNVYHDNTGIPEKIKDVVGKLVKPYLKKINDKLHHNYGLATTENIIVQHDTNGNIQYIVDMFIHDKDLHIIQKIIVDVIVYVDGRIWLNKIIHSNAREPLEHIDNYNDIHGSDTNSVIRDSNMKKDSHVNGVEGSSLHSSSYKAETIRPMVKQPDINEWILPKEMKHLEDKGVASFPCGTTSEVWNSHGVLQNKKPEEPCRGGYNTSTSKAQLLPNVNRTTFELDRNSGDYASYFAMTRGIPQL
tara:strand:+ start:1179 stop:2123 length:945 start_codon:yes stop_codon:yes gene_type:complete